VPDAAFLVEVNDDCAVSELVTSGGAVISVLGENEDVKAFLEGSKFKKSMYMIIELKIAKGRELVRGQRGVGRRRRR
jgi:hypothetical protein